MDVYTEITGVTSAGERSWKFVGVASEPIDCWKFDHLADWFDFKPEYETRLKDDYVEFGGIVEKERLEQVSLFLNILWLISFFYIIISLWICLDLYLI